MKKIITTLLLVATLIVVPSAQAETVTCHTEQYGGSVCGVETSSSTTVVEHEYETGLDKNELLKIIAYVAGAAVVSTLLYKLTYKNYLLG